MWSSEYNSTAYLFSTEKFKKIIIFKQRKYYCLKHKKVSNCTNKLKAKCIILETTQKPEIIKIVYEKSELPFPQKQNLNESKNNVLKWTCYLISTLYLTW